MARTNINQGKLIPWKLDIKKDKMKWKDVLKTALDWQFNVDLEEQLKFPELIIETALSPDMISIGRYYTFVPLNTGAVTNRLEDANQ